MKTTTANLKRQDIVGDGDRPPDRETLTAISKQWRHKLGVCSIFATVPAMLLSHIPKVRAEEAKEPEVSVAGRTTRFLERLINNRSNPELLKRQSEFRLPHQKGSSDMLAPLAGNDDCPGRAIPGGTYTAAAPYIDSGDTTGANDTISHLQYYYYYTFDTLGPDHIYSFTLTGRGQNPQIQVSTASATYSPLIYILQGGFPDACPAGTGNTGYSLLLSSGAPPGGTATIDSQLMSFLPLNVPLHLFIDSFKNDASGSGPYTIRMQDVTIAPAAACPNPNPIDCPDVFVRQHYLDFLNREPDPLAAQWVSLINTCPPQDTSCDRIHVSEAFFKSPEFQERGYFVYRFYSASFGRKPDLAEFVPDLARVSGFLTPAELEAAKVAFINDFMTRPAFASRYNGLNNTQYVDTLLMTAGVTLGNRQALIDALNSGSLTKAQVLRQIAESTEVSEKYFNQAFVVMEYFGYLRRDPDILYLNWIEVLNQGGDSRHMVNGFVNSIEYRHRFGP